MKVSMDSSFTAFELTQEETLAGYTFHEANKCVIQNLISAAAEDIVRLVLAPGEPLPEDKERIAYLRGQVEILKYLLVTSEVMKEELEAKELQNKSQ